MSVCLGPFTASPAQLTITLQARNFVLDNLFNEQKARNFEKAVLQDKSSGLYYLLLIITNSLVIQDDICILIHSGSTNKLPPLNFRFWLNVNYVPMKREMTNDVTINDFVQIPESKLAKGPKQNDTFLRVEPDKTFQNCSDVAQLLLKHA